MTHDEAAKLICPRCRRGEAAEQFTAGYFFHGNSFVRCDASPIWADAAAATS